MDLLNAKNFSGKVLDHLGLVADKIDELKLVQRIDEKLPLHGACKVTMGERVAAMILNGLGFVDTRLYMFPEFLKNAPVSRLFGREIDAGFFNDDSLGRCLDAISDYGVTKLFTELSFKIGVEKKLLAKSAHFDTSTLQLWGEYEDSSLSDGKPSEGEAGTCEMTGSTGDSTEQSVTEVKHPIPMRGYSKSHRHDLKQMVINLATTGRAAFPIWMESHSGNASDKKILPDAALRMREFCRQLSGAPDFLYVGDAAMYDNILKHSAGIKWLSRVPENILQAKKLISRSDTELKWNILSDGYACHIEKSNHSGVDQRWLLVFSEQAFKKEIATLNRNISKEHAEYEKKFWHIGNEVFSCQQDAQVSINKISKKMKYHQPKTKILEVRKHEKSGRPQKDEKPVLKGYRVECTLEKDEEKIAVARSKKGRFILATNELDEKKLSDFDMLPEYKAQSGTESGFKFIKDDTFELDSVFLKTPSRISALMMIMALCLMVYGVSQHDLRQSLKIHGKTLPDQKRKPTDKPSMKWIYYLFRGAHELTANMGGISKQIVINVNELMEEIIGYFGERARAIYFNTA
jgi:transposase